MEPRDIRFVLHRPKRSENIGAAARALANAGAPEPGAGTRNDHTSVHGASSEEAKLAGF